MKKQRKRRQADVGHRIRAVVALPLVGKGTAGRSQSIQKLVQNQHTSLNHVFKPGGNPTIQRNLELLAAVSITEPKKPSPSPSPSSKQDANE